MRGALVLAVVLGCSTIGFAAGGPDDRAAARDHFQKGTKFFDLGKFEDAVKEYEAAYELIDDPVLLYNIAQAHRLAGHTERALFFYRSFLRRNPNAKNQDEVNLKIAELQKALDQQARAQGLPPSTPLPPPKSEPSASTPAPSASSTAPAPAPSSTPPTEPAPTTAPPTTEPPPPATTTLATTPSPAPVDRGRTKKLIGFGLVGLGGAALIGAIVSTVLSKNETDAISNEASTGGVFDPAHEHASQTDGIAAGVLYGVGAAALAAGGVMIYLGYRDSKRAAAATVQLVPDLSPQRAGARAIIRF